MKVDVMDLKAKLSKWTVYFDERDWTDWGWTPFRPLLKPLWEVREKACDEIIEPIIYFRKNSGMNYESDSSWETLSETEDYETRAESKTSSTTLTSLAYSSSEEELVAQVVKKTNGKPSQVRNRKWIERLRRVFKPNVIYPESALRDAQYQKVIEWRKKIQRESTALDRQLNGILREEEKIKRSVKEAAKKGDKDVCRIYAKELVRSRRAISKIYVSKAHLNSIQMHMQEQLAILKTSGSLQKSTQVMQAVSALIKIPEVAQTMRELSKEMMKAGIMEERKFDYLILRSLIDQDGFKEATEEEIDDILWEVTAGQIGRAPAAGKEALPTPAPSAAAMDSEEEDEEELEKMQSRLEALRS